MQIWGFRFLLSCKRTLGFVILSLLLNYLWPSEQETHPSLVHFPHACNTQVWAKSREGQGSVWQKTDHLSYHSCLPQSATESRQRQESELGTKPRYSDLKYGQLNCCLTTRLNTNPCFSHLNLTYLCNVYIMMTFFFSVLNFSGFLPLVYES